MEQSLVQSTLFHDRTVPAPYGPRFVSKLAGLDVGARYLNVHVVAKVTDTKMSSGRNPYPYPRLENDTSFTSLPSEKKPPVETKRKSIDDSEKWKRLNATKTLASTRHEFDNYDPQVPNDSLDLVLKTQYNHSEEFMRTKAETLVQPETAGLPHGRILKNRPVAPKPVTLADLQLSEYSPSRKTTTDSSKGLAIESHHSEATNRGYSRKHDGGFYST